MRLDRLGTVLWCFLVVVNLCNENACLSWSLSWRPVRHCSLGLFSLDQELTSEMMSGALPYLMGFVHPDIRLFGYFEPDGPPPPGCRRRAGGHVTSLLLSGI